MSTKARLGWAVGVLFNVALSVTPGVPPLVVWFVWAATALLAAWWLAEHYFGMSAYLREPHISVECHLSLMPDVMPVSGRIHQIQLFPRKTSEGGGQIENFGHPGSPRAPIKHANGLAVHAIECRVTNHSAAALFDVRFDMAVAYEQAAGVPERPWPIYIGQLDPGPANAFVLYVINYQPFAVTVTMPTKGTALALGSSDRRPIRIVRPGKSSSWMHLTGFMREETKP